MLKKDSLAKFLARVFNVNIFHAPARKITTAELDVYDYCARMYRKVESLKGDVVECGVGKGGTFLFFSYLVNRDKTKRTIWGFDSFEGFPEPSEEDASARNPKKGEWSDTSQQFIEDTLKRAYVSLNNAKFVKGFFENTLDSYSKEPIALLHIDVDLFDSYKLVLEELFPYVAEGGVIMFDEYDHPNWPGATKAIDEFLQKTNQTLEQDPYNGKRHIVKK